MMVLQTKFNVEWLCDANKYIESFYVYGYDKWKDALIVNKVKHDDGFEKEFDFILTNGF